MKVQISKHYRKLFFEIDNAIGMIKLQLNSTYGANETDKPMTGIQIFRLHHDKALLIAAKEIIMNKLIVRSMTKYAIYYKRKVRRHK